MYPSSKSYQYFRGLVLIATILALCVVVLGAYVRLTDAGLVNGHQPKQPMNNDRNMKIIQENEIIMLMN